MRKLLVALSSIIILFSSCSTNNVTEDNSLQHFFDSAGVKGCFALYDNGQGAFTVYNLSRYRDSAYPPGNTFDILESLIAFQTGVIKDDKAVIHAGDTAVPLGQAFHAPYMENTAVFKKLTDSIGRDSLRKWVDSLHYGNQALDKDSAALYDADLKIPADEQLVFIKSWNEWAEGIHLEPDLRFGTGYLAVIRDELRLSPGSSGEVPDPSTDRVRRGS